ncbi:hypothetical protein K3495_g9664 [Podosphaera aphanis]|nr:hypothetical protein K3495_g9664 [Podosphaera aphanis]
MSLSHAEWSPNRDRESSEIIEEPLKPNLEALLSTLVLGTLEDLTEKSQAFVEPLGYSLAKKNAQRSIDFPGLMPRLGPRSSDIPRGTISRLLKARFRNALLG